MSQLVTYASTTAVTVPYNGHLVYIASTFHRATAHHTAQVPSQVAAIIAPSACTSHRSISVSQLATYASTSRPHVPSNLLLYYKVDLHTSPHHLALFIVPQLQLSTDCLALRQFTPGVPARLSQLNLCDRAAYALNTRHCLAPPVNTSPASGLWRRIHATADVPSLCTSLGKPAVRQTI